MSEAGWIELALGGLAGVISSFGFWWVFAHRIVPQVKFSAGISKVPEQPSAANKTGYRWRIKFGNFGRRNVIDLEVRAKLRIKGLNLERPINREVVYIPLDGFQEYKISILRPWIHDPNAARSHVLTLGVNLVTEFATSVLYPQEIRELAARGELTLEDILSLGTEATIQIEVFGYDAFSGARKLFLSPFYQVSDIKEGKFGGEKGLELG